MTAPHLAGLNPEQHRAVTLVEGPLLVLAGAGSGKTRVLTHRIAHLLHTGIPPSQVLAVTFTNKAASEMRRRVEALVGPRAREILLSTFHSACARFLRRDAPLLDYPGSFAIYDDDDQLRLLRDILRDLGIRDRNRSPAMFRHHIDQARNRMLSPAEACRALPSAVDTALLQEVHVRYEAALRAARAFDFNDLVNKMVELLETRPALARRYRDRFRYLLVDEFQDTNGAQYRLLRALAGPEANLAVVGDDDQSIYAFRGARVDNILAFEKDHPGTRVVRLERNYRSTGRILQLAGALVQHNRHRMEKSLVPTEPEGEPVRALVGTSENDEARRVVQEIRHLVRQGHRYGDVAIIYRTNAYSRPFEQALSSHRIPYAVVGGRKFYERREVRDILGYLRLLGNPADDMAFARVVNTPSRGVGPRTLEQTRNRAQREGIPLLAAARALGQGAGRAARALSGFVRLYDDLASRLAHLSLDALVLEVSERTGYRESLKNDPESAEERLQNIQALADLGLQVERSGPRDRAEPLQIFLDQAALAGQDEQLPDDDGQVTLLTAHLAKGLEFPVVFVVGLVEGIFPHARSVEKERDVEEERRLAYVACTRAERRLYLSHPVTRLVRSSHARRGLQSRETRRSRFLIEVEQYLDRGPSTGPADLRGGTRSRGGAQIHDKARSQRRFQQNDLMRQFLARHGEATAEPEPPPDQRILEPDSPEAFRPGLHVRHPRFGEGRILAVDGSAADPRLRIRFHRVGFKTLKASHARLEIILDR